eukprot:9467567-Pyramimonas_sp.AAC.2
MFNRSFSAPQGADHSREGGAEESGEGGGQSQAQHPGGRGGRPLGHQKGQLRLAAALRHRRQAQQVVEGCLSRMLRPVAHTP